MGKFYALVTGMIFSLVMMKTTAQVPASSNYSYPDLASNFENNNIIEETTQDEETCSAGFESSAATTSPLTKKFTALPWHSNQKRPVHICWNFGDGSDTCIQYTITYPGPYVVTHTYEHPGLYEVCVKIIYEGGCEARKCKEVRAGEFCHADFEKFSISPTINPLYASFKAIPRHSQNKKPHVICWKFGDGKDTCIEYPANYTGLYMVRHKYPEAGNYEICVRIKYYGGCESSKCKLVQIGRRDSCRADFTRLPFTSSNNPLTVSLKALPWNSNNKKPAKICWKFGDGRDTCIEYSPNYTGSYNVRHTYHEPGIYEVCVKILYYGGCEASRCRRLQVGRPDECRAGFERIPIENAELPLVAGFKALPWHNNNKKPKLICWSFGDGQDTCVEYAQNFSGPYVIRHRYPQPGVYNVCIKIIYYGGCEAGKCREVTVGEPECRANFERFPVTTNTPLTAGFKALPWHHENKKPKTICWTFGDGKDTCIDYPEDYSGYYVVTHTYNHPGEYKVCIRIKYYGGCVAEKCREIIVEAPPDACRVKLFEIIPTINGLTRGFYAVPWHANNKRPKLVCWNFGDGSDTCIEMNSANTLPGLFIRHTFPGPGVYRACVKIVFEGGCITRDCVEVIIRPVTNVCGGFMTDSLTAPGTFKFKAFAIHNPNDPVIGYRWSFGDGSGATGREVTHVYNHHGIYEVCLTIKTEHGCETRICKKIIVPGNAQAVLQLSPNPVISELNALFYSTHTEPVNIKIVNANGVIVRTYTRNAVAGSNNWVFDVSGLLPGVYTFVVNSPNQLSSAIFIKN